jgi:hypothetical protein
MRSAAIASAKPRSRWNRSGSAATDCRAGQGARGAAGPQRSPSQRAEHEDIPEDPEEKRAAILKAVDAGEPVVSVAKPFNVERCASETLSRGVGSGCHGQRGEVQGRLARPEA